MIASHMLDCRVYLWKVQRTVLVLLVVSFTFSSNDTSAEKLTKTKISDHPVIIVISYDGFRYDYMVKTETPYLDQIKTDGVSAAYMINQFPTKTFPNHFSIATGLHTESHGITDNNLFDRKLNKTLGPSDEDLYHYREDVVPLWTLNEWAGEGRVSGTMMWPGSNFAYGANKTLPTYSVAYNPSVPFESRIDTMLTWITNKTSPANLVFMYFEEPDGIAHGFGPESESVREEITKMDNLTGYLMDKLKGLGIFEKMNLILLSDHGFHEVTERSVINISSIIDPGLYTKYGGSPVYNILPHEGQLDILYSAFLNASKSFNFTVYKRDELDSSKPHWFYQNNAQRIMPLVMVADTGFVFDDYAGINGSMAYYDRKFNVSHTPNRTYGVHGYDNNDRSMQPYFLAHGPLFASGEAVGPFYNVDLFPFICKILQINPPPNNGTSSRTQPLVFRKGYHLGGTTVGWLVGASVIIAVAVLSAVMYLMAQKRQRDQPLLSSSNIAYRFVNSLDDSEDCLEDISRINENENGLCMVDVDEHESLLTSSSNEEIDH